MPRLSKVSFLFAPILVAACFHDEKHPVDIQNAQLGSFSLRIAVDSASRFASIVKHGTVTISGKDMETRTVDMNISPSGITAKLEGIPVGKERTVTARAFDSTDVAQYQGATTVDIFSDSTTTAELVLKRITGTLIIVGKIEEGDTAPQAIATPMPDPTPLAMGAQASSSYGAILDVDSKMVWFAATAVNRQSEIDWVFSFYSNNFHLDDAVKAKQSGLNMTIGFADSEIKTLNMTELKAMPTSQEEAKSAFQNGWWSEGSVVESGDIFVVRSTGGKWAVIVVKELSGTGASGTMKLDLYPLSIP